MQLLTLAILGLGLISAPKASPPGIDDRVAAIAPFVDDQTIAVIRIDAQRMDVPKVKQLLQSLSGGYDPQGTHAEALLSWIPQYVKAGGKELYVVVSLADFSQGDRLIVAPLSEGASAPRILEVLTNVPAFHDEVREQMGSAILLGSKSIFERLKAAKPTPRKELAAAFEAGGNAALQVLFLPTADGKRVIEELLPTLPQELGGVSVKVLTRGILWATLAIDSPPASTIQLVIQSEDTGRARALADFFNNNLSRFATVPQVEATIPGLANILKALNASVTADRVTLSLDGSKMVDALKPAARKLHDRAYRMTSMNNLRQIALALHSYHDANHAFPAVANFDAQGKPLLSWRVHILPFLGEKELYKEFHLDEPWDSEHNKKLVARIPKVFVVPGVPNSDKGITTYLAPVAANAMWTGTANKVKIQDVTDGTSNTILVVDAADKLAIPWTKPEDYVYDTKNPAVGLSFRFGDRAIALLTDGSVRTLPKALDAKALLALFTRNGGEVVSY